MVCRRAFTREKADGTNLSQLTIPVHLELGGKAHDWSLRVAQGACRVAQNIEPVAPQAAWLRQAVADGRLPAYSRERAWVANLKPLARSPKRGDYDPASLGPRTDGATGAPSSNNNYVGVTSPQGGEYAASRGFLHNADARVVDAALHKEDARIEAFWPELAANSWYSLAQPQGAVWSLGGHTTVDPQVPQAGERAWETPIWHAKTSDAVDSLTEVKRWSRDLAHMENTGFVHWILTEDPVAGLLLQRQAAYALGSRYADKRRSGSYSGYTLQERGILNKLSALWKSRDVARRVSSKNGKVIWSAARAEAQARGVIAFYDAELYQPMAEATPGASEDYLRRLASVPLSEVFNSDMELSGGKLVKVATVSDFMLPQYGKEPLYLWTRAGNDTVRDWFEAAAKHVATRLTVIGGAAGSDDCGGSRGSSIPLAFTDRTPSWQSAEGWGKWVASLCPTVPRDRYDGAAVHTTMQHEGLLLLARDAGITGLDAAIARVEADRDRTKAFRYTNLQMHKHLAGPL
jgi:hypothetical protein